MIHRFILFRLVAGSIEVCFAADSQRTLSAPPSLGQGIEAKSDPVKDSKMLFTTTPIAPGSATDFIVHCIVEVEKLIEGVSGGNESEMKKRDPAIRKIISSVLDLDGLGRAALATHWSEISKTGNGKKSLERYLKLFHDLVEENYLEKIRVYLGGNYRITFTGEDTIKQGSAVRATIKKKDADLVLEFYSRKTGTEWRVFDTRLDETSLEETYRGSFNRIIKKNGGPKNGFPELLKVMEKRLAELKKGKATKL